MLSEQYGHKHLDEGSLELVVYNLYNTEMTESKPPRPVHYLIVIHDCPQLNQTKPMKAQLS